MPGGGALTPHHTISTPGSLISEGPQQGKRSPLCLYGKATTPATPSVRDHHHPRARLVFSDPKKGGSLSVLKALAEQLLCWAFCFYPLALSKNKTKVSKKKNFSVI